MQILKQKITGDDLRHLERIGEAEEFFPDMVKLVVDIKRELVALNAELHSDLEALLLENGSANRDLYGINIDFESLEIEFDSLINPPRNREAGYPRAGRTVASPEARQRIEEVVAKWIEI